MTALVLEAVHKTRGAGRHAVQALRGVTLGVGPGEFVLLEGPSGAGKTTLLAVAAGLLTPDAGRVLLAGRPLDAETPSGRRRLRATAIGFVFQRSNLLAGLTVRENTLLMALLAGMAAPEASRETDALLETLGIAGLASSRPDELSGGEEQRAAVARALVHRPKVVLADEPTGSLDGASGRAVADALARLAAARQAAVLVATHDARLEPFATRRLRIVDGRLDGTA